MASSWPGSKTEPIGWHGASKSNLARVRAAAQRMARLIRDLLFLRG
jgi:hypothetical protein